jgi:uncharacterized damage-inducible protein DinB
MMANDNLLVRILEEAYRKQAWHGPNLRGALRGVSAELAAWRPAPMRHNIWEQALHAAYWKYAAWRRITGEKRGSFPLKGSNWFPRDGEGGEPAWRADLKLLDETHERLVETVSALSPRALEETRGNRKTTVARLVYGAALHDVYHAGQIQLLERLFREC